MFLGKQIDNLLERAYQNNLHVYKTAITEVLGKDDPSEDELKQARNDYLNAVSEMIYGVMAAADPKVFVRYKLARLNPEMAGIPEEAPYCAGYEYCLVHYAFLAKPGNPINASKHNHRFNDYLNSALDQIESGVY